jgi:hypothetical protein
MKTGLAHLPLHGGKAPSWLFQRMTKLAREMTLVIIQEQGSEAFLKKLSDPYWFQAFGCVLGFDWHSSGVTTTVCGALKEGLKDISYDIGLYVCGGKGGTSRKTPLEIENIGQNRGVDMDPASLIYASRMSAKIDSTAVQDGYQLYHHCFIFNKKGNWAVVQQGMNNENHYARRYHWLNEIVTDFVCEPHAAVCAQENKEVFNMVALESHDCREITAQLASHHPEKILREFNQIKNLRMPARHYVCDSDIQERNLKKILEKTYEIKPEGFEELLNVQGVGPKTIRALALVSEVIYGKPVSFRDPARFSFAHGGKDGHPYPVDRRGYDQTIDILQKTVQSAKIGHSDKLKALKRLEVFYG